MSEETITKDGSLYFNTPDRVKRKPNVVYYDIGNQTTGTDYVKKKEAPPPVSSLWKILVSAGSFLAVASIVGVIYLVVVKFWGKGKEGPEKTSATLAESEEGSLEGRVAEVDVDLGKEPPTMEAYFDDIYNNDMSKIPISNELP